MDWTSFWVNPQGPLLFAVDSESSLYPRGDMDVPRSHEVTNFLSLSPEMMWIEVSMLPAFFLSYLAYLPSRNTDRLILNTLSGRICIS